MDIYLFLDFDGVLHTTNGKRFHCAEYFADIISKYDNVKIVFSTSWREYATVERLTEYLPNSIKHKCVGKTVVVKQPTVHPRFKEICIYNEEHGISDKQWIALDDMNILFPSGCPNLLLVNPKTGFSEKEANMLDEKINSLLKLPKMEL